MMKHWCGLVDIEGYDNCTCGHVTADHDWAGCKTCPNGEDGCTVDVYTLRKNVVWKARKWGWHRYRECTCRTESFYVEEGGEGWTTQILPWHHRRDEGWGA